MKVLVPCAGKSSRFPGVRPKWMLTHPDGSLMVKKSVDGLKGIKQEDIVITILREHEEKYDIVRGLKEDLGEGIKVVILDNPTSSQSETVYLTLKKADIKGGFLVKDSDNIFSVEVPSQHNYICYSDLKNHKEINPGNKSYIIMDNQSVITDMVEKKIVSRAFNVGGYFFKDAEKFIRYYERLSKEYREGELYLSSIVKEMIKDGEIFIGREATEYHDWGTFEDWQKYRKKFRVFVFDIDGILLKNGAQFHNPRWENAPFLEKNLEKIKELSSDPYVQIFFLTSKPEKYRKWLEKKFMEAGIKHNGILMGCLHAKRSIVNDFSTSTGYPTCDAINIPRDSEELDRYL